MEVKNKKTTAKKAAPAKAPAKKSVTKVETKKAPVKKSVKPSVKLPPIKAMRLQKGISAKKLAEMAGVSSCTILSIEKGEGDPKFSSIVKIMNALGYKVAFELK